MMNVLFLFPYPLNESPSQRFRFEQYLGIIEHSGISCQTQSFWSIATWQILYKQGFLLRKILGFAGGMCRRMWALVKASRADFVFIHRECAPVGPPFFEWIIANVLRKKIIYDFDDAIWLPNTSDENKLAALVKWHGKVADICRWSYKVSCGNQYLADYARQFNANVVVNPTTIDTNALHNPALYPTPSHTGKVVIGWTGTHSTLKYIDPVVPVLQKLESRYPETFEFMVIANRKPDLPLRNVTFIPWTKHSEIPDLLRFDIGIMPLTDDIWAKGKCGFKALQYMALGIPAIVSPVGVNTEIVDSKVNGFVADSETEWLDAIIFLIDHADERRRMGNAGRKKIEQHYSVASNSSTVRSLFLQNERTKASPKKGSNGIL